VNAFKPILTRIAAAFAGFAGFVGLAVSPLLPAQEDTGLPRIAHAGGQIDEATYTNSLEALNASYTAGFRAFEIDFSWTSDGHVVCLHDWEESFERSFALPPTGALSLAEFQQLVQDRSAYEKCTLSSLMQWLEVRPDTVLVTDAKERNIETLAHISAHYPQFLPRILPQIYQPEEYPSVRELGFGEPIWTLYEYPGGPVAVLDAIDNMELFAVAMNTRRAVQGLGLELDLRQIPSYVHTVNDFADWLYFQSLGVDEIYTDNLSRTRELELAATDLVTLQDSPVRRAMEARSRELARRKELFFTLPRIQYSLAEDFSLAGISTNQVAMLNFHDSRLDLTASGTDPYINFPPFAEPTLEIGIYVHVDVPDSTTLEVFYATQGHPGFSESLKLSEQTVVGSNEIVIGISAQDPITRFRIDPGTVAGNYTITRLEVRSH